jgi:type II secretory pathway component PulL
MAQRILALELADDRVAGALAERAWSSFALLGTYESERAEDEDDLVPALRRLLTKTGQPDLVISAIPGELVAKRLLNLPFTDRRKLDQAVPFALEEHLPFSIEEAVVAYVPMLREGNNSVVLAGMVRRDDLRAHLDQLAGAGLDPKTVTLSSLALSTLINRTRNGNGAASHLLVEFEQRRTSVILMDAGVPRALRTLPIGIDPGIASENPDISADAIIAAVRQTLLSHSAEPGSTDLIVSGPAAASPAVRDRFSRELSLPIHGVEDLDCSHILGNSGREWIRQASCVAMLLGETPNQPVPLINFRVGEFAFHGRTGDLSPFYTSGIIAAVLGFLMVLHVGLGISVDLHHLRLLNRGITAAAAPVVTGVSADQAERVVASHLAAARKRLGLLGGSGGPASPLDMLLFLSRALPNAMAIDLDEMDLDETGLKLSGKADSYASVEQLRKALAATHRLNDVQVSEEGAAEGHKVVFHLSAGVKE